MPNQPEYSLCESLDEHDVIDYLQIATNEMPEGYDYFISIARNDELSVAERAGILSNEIQSKLRRDAEEIDIAQRGSKKNSIIRGIGFVAGRAVEMAGRAVNRIPWMKLLSNGRYS